MNTSSLGDRMKAYEDRYENTTLANRPFAVRVDGRNFSGWTNKLESPYDERLLETMDVVAMRLLEKTQGSVLVYTQSDEISIIFYQPHYQSQPMFGGRVQKLSSVIASMTTAFFQQASGQNDLSGEIDTPMQFDGRVFGLPSLVEAYNYLVWRERDATRNSIRLAGQEHFSSSELYRQSNDEVQEMLWQQKNINWNDYPARFKRGQFIVQQKREKTLTEDELADLPPEHNAHDDPEIETTIREKLSIPPITQLENPGEVLFDTPITLE